MIPLYRFILTLDNFVRGLTKRLTNEIKTLWLGQCCKSILLPRNRLTFINFYRQWMYASLSPSNLTRFYFGPGKARKNFVRSGSCVIFIPRLKHRLARDNRKNCETKSTRRKCFSFAKVLIMEKLYNNGITDIRIYLRTNIYHYTMIAFFVFLTSFKTYGILRIYFIFS